MTDSASPLSELEHTVLLVVAALGEDAYGMRVRESLSARTGRDVAIASVYAALERLERRGLLASDLGDPTPERGGRAKRYYNVEAAGLAALAWYRDLYRSLWADAGGELDRVSP